MYPILQPCTSKTLSFPRSGNKKSPPAAAKPLWRTAVRRTRDHSSDHHQAGAGRCRGRSRAGPCRSWAAARQSRNLAETFAERRGKDARLQGQRTPRGKRGESARPFCRRRQADRHQAGTRFSSDSGGQQALRTCRRAGGSRRQVTSRLAASPRRERPPGDGHRNGQQYAMPERRRIETASEQAAPQPRRKNAASLSEHRVFRRVSHKHFQRQKLLVP